MTAGSDRAGAGRIASPCQPGAVEREHDIVPEV